MVVLLVAVFGLALIDSVNPSAIAVTLYLLLTGRSYTSRVLTYLAAVLSSYLLIGMLLILGLDAIWDYLYSPAAYAVQGVVGALMRLVALQKRRARDYRGRRGWALSSYSVSPSRLLSFPARYLTWVLSPS